MKHYVVTGGLGFIGSNLVRFLMSLDDTDCVVVIDDESSGKLSHLREFLDGDGEPLGSKLIVMDNDITVSCPQFCFEGADCVFHLAANPDARRGIEDTFVDLSMEAIATRNVLEAMRKNGAKKIVLASSGTVYGDIGETPAVETMPMAPISLYGAGKVASEALVHGFAGTFDMSGVILRFGNVVGAPATHGCIYDFVNQLKTGKGYLDVLGDGNQSKPYIHVRDIVGALMYSCAVIGEMGAGEVKTYNVAPVDHCSVRDIAKMVASEFGVTDIRYSGGKSGWAGDVPRSRMNCERLFHAGFCISALSREAVSVAIKDILKHENLPKKN